MLTPVRVFGTVRDSTGALYSGAVIEVYLNDQMSEATALYGNEMHTVYSGDYGTFEIFLVPSVNSYYTFKIIKETTNVYSKIVPNNILEVPFDSLPDYAPASSRVPLLGDLNKTINTNPVLLPNELVGIFQWHTIIANGTSSVFTAPGQVFLVSLNGVVQSENVDYIRRDINTIDFYNSTPLNEDLISILYRI